MNYISSFTCVRLYVLKGPGGVAAARAWNRTHVWICMLILCDVQILSTTGTWKKEIRSAFSSAVRPPSLNEPIAE